MEINESGSLHIQAACGNKKMRLLTLRVRFPNMYIKECFSSLRDFEYCQKSDTRRTSCLWVAKA